ncbi:MAG TPA: alpha/beta hydrolase [Flavobacteriales bacterium]|nr:alpha/beta hydrolase [Flavobacteriales bacterium]
MMFARRISMIKATWRIALFLVLSIYASSVALALGPLIHGAIQRDTLTLLDSARNRAIPVALYRVQGLDDQPRKVVIISHGYNENLPGTYLRFSSLAEYLAVHGYAVVSIQHELPTDEPLPMNGDLRVLRRPNWERGVENIRFVLDAMKAQHPQWDFDQVALVGHSNGGDISMLFAQTYPKRVNVAISLDNRRMPLPRTSSPRIASLRAEDVAADPGVLPTPEEQQRWGIRVIDMPGFKHVDFNDRGTPGLRARMNAQVVELLTDRGRP